MAIFKLYDSATPEPKEDDETNIKTCPKLSIWKSIGLRFAFFFASLFCVFWFSWSLIALFAWTLRSLITFKVHFLATRKKVHYRKSLGLTIISFFGCTMACISPYVGLSFLSAYFGLFAKDFSKEGIHLDDLIARVKRLSA